MLPIQVNEHTVGIVLKEIVRRAIRTIRAERENFEAKIKMGYTGEMNDVLTSADTKAQEIFAKSIAETLPGVGVIGEEELHIPCTLDGCDDFEIYITIDPLDGTKAFVRKQSHGITTMVALVLQGKVISAWIGDINTQEIYGFRPGSVHVHRIIDGGASQYLNEVVRFIPVKERYLLARKFPDKNTHAFWSVRDKFHDVHIDGGSIGGSYTRLWKGEMSGLYLGPTIETPWDLTPVVGISQHLGFVYLRWHECVWKICDPKISTELYERTAPMLVVHSSIVDDYL